MFTFRVHPARLTIGDGLAAAWNLLVRTVVIWAPAVVAVAIVQAVLAAAERDTGAAGLITIDQTTNEILVAPDAGSILTRLFALTIVVTIVGMVATWVFAATAISGLRGRPLTAGWIVVAGLKTLVAGVLLAIATLAAFLLLFVLLAAVRSVGLLLFLAAIPLTIYFVIRVMFVELAIFDGAGVVEGIQAAWRLSSGAVLRLLGWGLVVVLIAIVVGIARDALVAGMRQSSPFVADLIASVITTTLSCYFVYLLATVYESQRARQDPTYAPPAGVAPPEFNDPWSQPRPRE